MHYMSIGADQYLQAGAVPEETFMYDLESQRSRLYCAAHCAKEESCKLFQYSQGTCYLSK